MWRPTTARWVQAFFVLAALDGLSAQFSFPHIDGIKLPGGDPVKAAEALHGSFERVAEGIKDAANGDAAGMEQLAQHLEDAGRKKVEEATSVIQNGVPGDITASLPTDQVADAIRSAAGSLERGAQAINRTTKEDLAAGVSSAFQNVQGAATSAVQQATGVANSQDVAHALESHAGTVAGLLNRTGLQVAGALAEAAPKAADAIRKAAAGQHAEEEDPYMKKLKAAIPEVEKRISQRSVPLAIVLVVGVVGGMCVMRHYKSSNARAPGLLADNEMGMSMHGGRRQQLGSDEPFFTQF